GRESPCEALAGLRERSEMLRRLREVRCNQRKRSISAPAFHREHARDRVTRERISGESVQRVGRDGDHAAAANPGRRLLDGIALRRARIDEHPPHAQSTIVVRTISATRPISATSAKNTTRSEAPPARPATNGLLAIPISDALVSTPKPAPWAPGGITAPAAL